MALEQGEPITVGAYDLFVEGLKAIASKSGVEITEAAQLAIDNARKNQALENIPYIEAALDALNKQHTS